MADVVFDYAAGLPWVLDEAVEVVDEMTDAGWYCSTGLTPVSSGRSKRWIPSEEDRSSDFHSSRNRRHLRARRY